MPRIRSIKPQFWLDEELGSIKRDARLLYIGLWNLCDDRGVFEYKPGKIRVQLFPYDNDMGNGTIKELLNLLEQSGHFIKFNEKGEVFGYIKTFLKHQDIKKPSKWAFTDTLPDTNSNLPVTQQSPTSNLPVTQQSLKEKEKEKEKIKGKEKKEEKENIVRQKFGEFLNVFLSTEEHGKLVSRFGEQKTKELIETLSTGIKSKGYKYQDYYATILNWSRREGRKDGQSGRDSKAFHQPTRYTRPDEL